MWTTTAVLVLNAALLAADTAPKAEADVKGAEAAPKLEPVVIEISKATTFLEGPLHKDGTVDYVAALDAIQSKGVTKENNAAPLLARAFGGRWGTTHPLTASQAKRLGIEPPAAEAHCLTTIHDLIAIARVSKSNPEDQEEARLEVPTHAKATAALLSKEDVALLNGKDGDWQSVQADAAQLLENAMKAPWSAKEQPVLMVWLRVNAEPIKLLEAASKKERYYWPYDSGPQSSMIEVALPALGAVRDGCRVLACRAMLRIEQGDLTGAWDDALVICRLGRLVAQEPNLISQLVARSVEGLSESITLALLDSGRLTADQIKSMAQQHEKLGSPSNLLRALDLGERCFMLDTVGMMRRRGMRSIDQIAGETKPLTEAQRARNTAATDLVIDSNIVLKQMNEWMDDMTDALRKPTCMQRLEAARVMHERMVKLAADRPKSVMALIAAALVLPPEERRKVVSHNTTKMLLSILMPAITSAVSHDEEGQARRDMMHVAFALALHRAEKKTYPAKLAELVPAYLAALPVDQFDEKPLRYQRAEEGYVLYSVGRDQKDNGGRATRGDDGEADIVIQLLAAKPAAK